ncbi:hypothetical protein T08_5295 [Trichinella sp. T8]|nr:hypothetical protein T08_5295 [Trichinella sp. T8]
MQHVHISNNPSKEQYKYTRTVDIDEKCTDGAYTHVYEINYAHLLNSNCNYQAVMQRKKNKAAKEQ